MNEELLNNINNLNLNDLEKEVFILLIDFFTRYEEYYKEYFINKFFKEYQSVHDGNNKILKAIIEYSKLESNIINCINDIEELLEYENKIDNLLGIKCFQEGLLKRITSDLSIKLDGTDRNKKEVIYIDIFED